ncbi:MAG: InlB B-repeat-containing protein [Longibaculum sp.]
MKKKIVILTLVTVMILNLTISLSGYVNAGQSSDPWHTLANGNIVTNGNGSQINCHDRIYFGNFNQTKSDYTNGTKSPLLWRVLENQNNSIYLASLYALEEISEEAAAVHNQYPLFMKKEDGTLAPQIAKVTGTNVQNADITAGWKQSWMRTWLNGIDEAQARADGYIPEYFFADHVDALNNDYAPSPMSLSDIQSKYSKEYNRLLYAMDSSKQFLPNAFQSKENDAILKTHRLNSRVASSRYYNYFNFKHLKTLPLIIPNDQPSDDKIFLMSGDEYYKFNKSIGLTNGVALKYSSLTNKEDTIGYTVFADTTVGGLTAYSNGDITYALSSTIAPFDDEGIDANNRLQPISPFLTMYYGAMIRPCMNVDMSKIYYKTYAKDGKTNEEGKIITFDNYVPNANAGTGAKEYRLTLKDTSSNVTLSCSSEQTIAKGSGLEIPYTDATIGKNQQISCVLLDDGGNFKYYGKLKATDTNDKKSGTLTLPTDDIPLGHYTLHIYSEECNGDMKTDYASKPTVIDFTVSETNVPTLSVASNDATNILSTSATLNGTITGTGATIYGFEMMKNGKWEKVSQPATLSGNKLSCQIDNLTAETIYQFRAYAGFSEDDLTYGSALSFKTSRIPIEADENSIGIIGITENQEIQKDKSVVFEATGDYTGMETSSIIGDSAWKPVKWDIDTSDNLSNQLSIFPPYSATINMNDLDIGEHYLTVAFHRVVFDGKVYADSGDEVKKTVHFKVVENEVNEFTVGFNSNGGTTVEQQTITNQSKVTEPTPPTKEGYTFGGWYKEEACQNEWKFDTDVVTSNVILYAKWTPTEYKITYELNGGTNDKDNPTKYTIESEDITLKVPTKEGYTFKGWTYDEQNTPTVNIKIENGSTGNKSFTANWEATEYTITYNLDNGTNDKDNPTKYTIESEDITLKAPTKEGYTFKGWTYDGQTDPIKDVTISKGTIGDKTYTANWEVNKYTVDFNTDGGTDIGSQTVEHGETVTKPTDPVKEGFRFIDWYIDEWLTSVFDFTTSITEDITLYAKYQQLDKVVDPESDVSDTNPVSVGTKVTLSSDTKDAKIYYTTDGSTPSSSSTLYTGAITISKDMTIKAIAIKDDMIDSDVVTWNYKVTYEVTFDSQGGTKVESQSIVNQGKVTKPAEPTKEGYTFDGWYKETTYENDWKFDTDKITSNTTLYAKWTPTEYKIIYSLDNGTNDKDNPTKYTIESEDITLKAPTKEGYTFKGWTYDGQTDPIKDVTILKGSTGDKTYTAQWEVTEYTITYKLDGGTNDKDNPTKYTIESEDITLKAPTKEGYTFKGWTYDGQTDPIKDVTISKGTIGDKTYTANWEVNKYTVDFNTDGGTDIGSQTVEHGETVTKPTDPVKEGFRFIDWYIDEWLTSVFDFTTSITEDITLYAKYQQLDKVVDPESDVSDTNPVSVGTKVTLSSDTKDAKIYYTTDGSTPSSSSTLYTGAITISKDMTIKAIAIKDDMIDSDVVTWNYKVTYEVTFDSQGGTKVESQSIVNQGKVTKPAEPTKEGYTFDGWYKETTYENDWKFDTDKITSNTTLYAKWTPTEYKIIYSLDNGTNDKDNPTKYTIESEDITLKAPTKEGYTFKGWTYDGQTDPIKDVTISKGTIGDKTYTANWEVNKYTVDFNTDGGTDIGSQTVEHGETVTKPTDPVKEGFRFIDWYIDEWLTSVFDFTTSITEDITLYAKYQQLDKVVDPESDVSDTNPVSVGTKVTLSSDTKDAKIYYTTDGSTPSSSSTLYTGAITISKDMTIKAIAIKDDMIDSDVVTWNYKVTYEVTFDSQGGTKVESQSIVNQGKVTKPAEPTKEGYTFDGWYKETTYENDWKFDTDKITSNTTLYAKWTPTEYKIIYSLDNGTNDKDNPTKYTIESEDITLKAPTKEGYTFKGWTYDGQTDPIKDVTISKGTTGDKSYTANWQINEYTVTFHSDGGTSIPTQTIKYNDKIIKPANPTKDGFVFKGWYTDSALTNEYNFDTQVQKNIDLYAKYEELNIVKKPTSNIPDDKCVDKGTTVELSCSTQGATIYYTTDGSMPTLSSHKYTGPITIDSDMTIKAIGIKTGMNDSEVVVFQYRIKTQVAAPLSSHESGVISRKSNNITLSCATKNASIYYTVDGSDPKTNGKAYANGSLIKITKDTILKVWATMNDDENYMDSDIITYEYTMMAQVEKPTSSLNTETVKKGTTIELSTSTEKAKIYYTTDGTIPTEKSTEYQTPIILEKDMTIKAIAIKEEMDDSEVSIFRYQIKNEGNVDVIIKVEGPENITVPDKEDVLGAVLTDEDYELYKQGNDIIITLECIPLEDEPGVIDETVISGYQIGKHLDISIYKQIGNQEKEKVSELSKPIQLIVDVPNELLPDEDIVRIYSLLRVHEGEHAILEDKDEKLETITVESHKFSRYVILYKDIVSDNQGNHVEKPNDSGTTSPNKTTKTGDDSQLLGYGILLVVSLIGVTTGMKKRKYK